MSWNYRVLKRNNGKSDYYAIHEVYYRPDDTPEYWTTASIRPYGRSPAELQEDLSHMREALQQPILQEVTKNGEEILEEIN
jgi:hypothetical protein